MLKQSLALRLEEVSRRYRRLYRRLALAAVWCVAAALGGALLLAGQASLVAAAILVTLAACLGIAFWMFAQRPAKDVSWIARRIEARHPELNSLLVSAVEMQPLYGRDGFGFLQDSVLRRRPWPLLRRKMERRRPRLEGPLAHSFCNSPPLPPCSWWLACSWFAAKDSSANAGPLGSKDALAAAQAQGGVKVEPGDAEIERGSSLLVMARFTGDVPSEAELVLESPSRPESRQPMLRGLDDPIFGARVSEVSEDLEYLVAYTDGETRRYRITVFEFPALISADARLAFPSYTGLAETVVQDTRRVTAVVGTELTLECHLNKPVKLAWLQGEEGAKIELAADSADASLVARQLDAQGIRQVEAASGRRRRTEMQAAAGIPFPGNGESTS